MTVSDVPYSPAQELYGAQVFKLKSFRPAGKAFIVCRNRHMYGICLTEKICLVGHTVIQARVTSRGIALSAALNQRGCPVALSPRPPTVVNCIIKEAVRGCNFTLKTDQRSVAYMFNNRKRAKIKNNKIIVSRGEWL